ncbi:MAG: hypothetical protein Q4A70_02995 [Candidatus Saccharibacteria bacterium]|nr:hypothetical protein [Candidatus Saccharibacteria bacterium]
MKKTSQHPNRLSSLKKFFSKTKDYDLAIILSIINSLISIPLSSLIFLPPEDGIPKRNKLLVDILFFVIMIFVYRGLIFIIKNRHKYRKYIRFALIYFAILMVLLLLTWPGIWRGPYDEFIIASDAKRYIIYGWQHSLFSLFYMLCFKLIPFFNGVLIVQCIIISIITSYLYNQLVQGFKLQKLLPKTLLLIPFLLPPVFDYALYPLRPTLYSYSVILMLYLMIKGISAQKLSKSEHIFLIISFIISSTLRSEGIVFLLVAIVYYLYLFIRKRISAKISIYSTIIILLCSFFINAFQASTLDANSGYGYKVLSTANNLLPLVQTAAKDESNTELLSSIDKVMDVETIIKNPNDLNGTNLFFFGNVHKSDYSHAEYLDFMKSFLLLCLKYPSVVAKQSLGQFAQTIVTSTTLNDATAYTRYFDDDYYQELLSYNLNHYNNLEQLRQSLAPTRLFIEDGGNIMQPINVNLRNATIAFLEGRALDNYAQFTPLSYVLWNIILPLLSIIFIIVILLIKKHIAIALILSTILIKTAIVIFTAPGDYHMYYYAEYLLGYILLFLFLAYLTNHQKTPSLLPKRIQSSHKHIR